MSQQANEVFGLRILPDPKGCEIDVRYTEYTGDKNSYSFVLPANNFDKWNRDIDNNNIGDQRYGAVLIEISRVENRETQSGLIRHHETVYKSTKLKNRLKTNNLTGKISSDGDLDDGCICYVDN